MIPLGPYSYATWAVISLLNISKYYIIEFENNPL